MTHILSNITNWLTDSQSSSASLETNTDDGNSDWVGSEERKATANVKTETEYDPCNDFSESVRSSETAETDDNTISKVVHSAIEWGGFLLNYGKETSKNVTAKAFNHLKSALEENSSSESSATELASEEPVAPWIGYPNESAIKSQIMALSEDKRNFLRGPPAGVKFHFDYTVSYPVATVMLDEDPKLQTMRFELVPKQLKEETFWRNYFYHVALIKQSAQLLSRDKHKAGAASDDVNADHKVSALLTTSELDIEFVREIIPPGADALGSASKTNFNSDNRVDREPDNTHADDLEDFEMVEVNDCVLKTMATECA